VLRITHKLRQGNRRAALWPDHYITEHLPACPPAMRWMRRVFSSRPGPAGGASGDDNTTRRNSGGLLEPLEVPTGAKLPEGAVVELHDDEIVVDTGKTTVVRATLRLAVTAVPSDHVDVDDDGEAMFRVVAKASTLRSPVVDHRQNCEEAALLRKLQLRWCEREEESSADTHDSLKILHDRTLTREWPEGARANGCLLRVFGCFVSPPPQRTWLLMESWPCTLDDLLRQDTATPSLDDRSLALENCVELLADLGSALDFLHNSGYVHCGACGSRRFCCNMLVTDSV
jgi:hypothetical protein